MEEVKPLLDKINKINENEQQNLNNQENNKIKAVNESLKQFENKVKDYVKNNEILLYILTPCYGSMCYIDFTLSLTRTLFTLLNFGIKANVEVCRGDSLISRARNGLIAKAMNNGATHMLFIDSDITWDPLDVLKLIVSDENLIGGIYPKKKYNWSMFNNRNIIEEFDKKYDQVPFKDSLGFTKEEFPECKLVNYNLIPEPGKIGIVNNLLELKHLPTGFMMIRRKVIEDMSNEYKDTKYVDDTGFLSEEESKYAYALFDCRVENQQYMSEDWLFCNRYKKMGGKIYMDVSINLVHIGTNYYKGKTMSIFI